LRKGTIFKYELKRLFFSKEYLLLLAATVFYGISLLRGVVIFGAYYTAPFSRLTFSAYCASLTPFLFILLLVLCARQTKASERGAEAIISAAPMPLHAFRLMRYSAVVCAALIAMVLPVTVCFMFYWLVFDYTAVGVLLWTGLIILLPPAIFLFGAAMLLGNIKPAAVYVLLAAVMVVGVFQISLPPFLDIAGGSAVRPLNAGEYGFVFLSEFITGRVVFLVIGIALTIVSLCRVKKRPARENLIGIPK